MIDVDEATLVPEVPLLIVPGLGDSGPAHWQTGWEQLFEAQRVAQRDWDRPHLQEWLDSFVRHLALCAHPPLLVAHSLGCMVIAHWVARGGTSARGALLVAPPDVESPHHTPPEVWGFAPIPRVSFAFPSTVVASTNDPYAAFQRSAAWAAAWHSRMVSIKDAGHINSDSALGDWSFGQTLMADVLRS